MEMSFQYLGRNIGGNFVKENLYLTCSVSKLKLIGASLNGLVANVFHWFVILWLQGDLSLN